MYNFSINIRDTTIGLPHGSIMLFEFVGKKRHISLHSQQGFLSQYHKLPNTEHIIVHRVDVSNTLILTFTPFIF